jgi:uncharacterized membrane protein SpoIIM required for sporulation
MITARWIEKRLPHWSRLKELVERGSTSGISALSHNDLRELGLLYRQTAADLSWAREDPSGRRLAEDLNRLLGRAHNLVYTSRRTPSGALLRFVSETWPRVFRETLPYTAAATLLFVFAALAGLLTSIHDPAFQRFVLGGPMTDTIDRREMWTHPILAMKPLASSAILTNNLIVAFSTAASGVLAGVGTSYLIVFNGLLMGVIAAACLQAEMSLSLWSFVAPHGVLELPAIFISGGAGFLIAKGILFPGALSRKESVAREGGRAARLLLGVIPMLLLAGFIEGFFSPMPIGAGAKLFFAAVLGALFLAYLAGAGRARRNRVPAIRSDHGP